MDLSSSFDDQEDKTTLNRKKRRYFLICLILIILIGGGFYIYSNQKSENLSKKNANSSPLEEKNTNKTPDQNQQLADATPDTSSDSANPDESLTADSNSISGSQKTTAPTTRSGNTQNNSATQSGTANTSNGNQENSVIPRYDSPEGYSFSYPKGWSIKTYGNGAFISSNISSENIDWLSGPINTIISRVEYTGAASAEEGVTITIDGESEKTPDQQAKDLAASMDKDGKYYPIQMSGKSGYYGVSLNNAVSVLNIVLNCNSDMLMVQFTKAGSLESLTSNQRLIKNSLVVTK